MNDAQVLERINYALKIESELPDLEFKTASRDLPRDLWRSVSAFCHRRGGGLIVFGVSQDPVAVVGCTNVEEIQNKMRELLHDKMSFELHAEYHIFEIEKKTIVAVHVLECPDEYKPCFFKPLGLPRGACIREGNTTRQITDSEFRAYMAASQEFEYDLSEAKGVTIDEIDLEKVENLLRKREQSVSRGAQTMVSEENLINLNVIREIDGKKVPTLSGVLIFSSTPPQRKHPYDRYTVRCVRFAGNSTATSIIDKLDVIGTLDVQIEESYKFVLRNINTIAKIVGTKRVEQYEYPEKAIRELLANAIIHRDYRIIDSYTQVFVFKDRVEISNPGSLPPGVTIENIKDAQVSRNPVIAGRLKELDYLEEYGRGVDIVIEKMKSYDLPPPLFRNSVNSFKAILLGERCRHMNERQLKLIETLLVRERLTIQDCIKLIKNTARVTLNNDLKNLKNLGLINQMGGSRSTYYVIAI